VSNVYPDQPVRKAVLAGSWYPEDATELRNTIEQLMDNAHTDSLNEEIIGIISPHDSYSNSFETAAYSYAMVREQKYDVVVLIGPSHSPRFEGASVCTSGIWESPIGNLKVESAIARHIVGFDRKIRDSEKSYLEEQSLELQIPFIAACFGEIPIVPIAVGEQSVNNARRVADAIIAATEGKRVLLIASSNLSTHNILEEVISSDDNLIERIENINPEGLLYDIAGEKSEACGAGAISVMLMAARDRGANEVRILNHFISRSNSFESSDMAGYLAAAIYRDRTKTAITFEDSEIPSLNRQDQDYLCKLARENILAALESRESTMEESDSQALHAKWGVYITLRIGGRIRGCMGQMDPGKNLMDTVGEVAAAAAFGDPEYKPLTKRELRYTDIEIAIVSPLKRVDKLGLIKVGGNGIYLKKGARSGLVLSQTAITEGWTRDQFLEAACSDAGFGGGCWVDRDVEVFVFRSLVFK